ncbi:filamentous hemagglutinin N-terminal domain-containing protein [Adonisia turfae]|uniref:Filamentous hemagglutinin N-terminal domain-containing protein n=1 Tax=Adonisia turfae CCMR0081 TaxID=2292702 RepID=A0A6M0RLQ2_9CYAN|nr:filamentous hemagglutinin N-terminal domain-containing protein [Adonisia turfae]NEZ57174.1 filamentous hemagglutinin N-terminal domain-containing protein [Adonisia turfae CCMR0081]
MKFLTLPVWLLSGTVSGLLITVPSKAQILPDGTLGSAVNVPNCNVCTITGGTAQGENLFHSFTEFSVPVNGEANFQESASAPGIENIFSRITGSSISNIDGLISTENSNLFLINPNGIVFGETSALNVNGSFLATTANSVDFGNDGKFSVNPLEVPSLLTITAPLGLGFGLEPGEIINRSLETPPGFTFPVGLEVPIGETLALVGGAINMDGGTLTAFDGRVEIGSVTANSFVDITGLTSEDPNLGLTYTSVENFQDISFSNFGFVDTSGDRGGSVQVQGRNLTMTDGSGIIAFNFGPQKGQDLKIRISESIVLQGDFTTIQTIADSVGDAGDINIETQDLIIQRGATIVSFASFIDNGSAGNISIVAPGSLEVTGQSTDGIENSTIQTEGDVGDGGEVVVEVGQLLLQGGGQISTSTFGSGQAGNLTVNVSRVTELVGTAISDGSPSGLFAQVEDAFGPATGSGGQLTLNTRELVVLDGAQISTAAQSGGVGGNAIITVTDSILLSGTAPNATPLSGSSGILTSAEPGSTEAGGDLIINASQLIIENGAKISADTLGDGPAGTATLNVDRLIISNGGLLRSGSIQGDGFPLPTGDGSTLTVNARESIDVSGAGVIGTDFPVDSEIVAAAEGTGNAGQLNLSAPLLIIRDGGNVRTNSVQTSGGQITIQADVVQLLEDGDIITAVDQGQGTGGNITIQGNTVVATGDSDILAFANEGTGGNITLPAFFGDGIQPNQDITSLEDLNALDGNDRVDVNATGQLASGTITFPDVSFIENSLTELPDAPIDTAALVSSSCIAPIAEQGSGRLIVTGSDSTPQQPGSTGITTIPTGDIRTLSSEAAESEAAWHIGDPITEPQGFYQLTDGRVVLSRNCL